MNEPLDTMPDRAIADARLRDGAGDQRAVAQVFGGDAADLAAAIRELSSTLRDLRQPREPNGSPFVTVEGLAQRLDLRVETVRGWCRMVGPGSIPRVRVGKRLMFDVTEVVTWIKTVKDARAVTGRRARRVPVRGRRRGKSEASPRATARPRAKTKIRDERQTFDAKHIRPDHAGQ